MEEDEGCQVHDDGDEREYNEMMVVVRWGERHAPYGVTVGKERGGEDDAWGQHYHHQSRPNLVPFVTATTTITYGTSLP